MANSLEKRRLSMMEVSVNQSSGEDSVGKEPANEPAFRHFNEQSIYTYSDDELGKKKKVNSMGSRLYVLRLSNHLSLPRVTLLYSSCCRDSRRIRSGSSLFGERPWSPHCPCRSGAIVHPLPATENFRSSAEGKHCGYSELLSTTDGKSDDS